MFVSKCKITLSLYHYCVASLPTDTIKIIITHFSIKILQTLKHTKFVEKYFWAREEEAEEIKRYLNLS